MVPIPGPGTVRRAFQEEMGTAASFAGPVRPCCSDHQQGAVRLDDQIARVVPALAAKHLPCAPGARRGTQILPWPSLPSSLTKAVSLADGLYVSSKCSYSKFTSWSTCIHSTLSPLSSPLNLTAEDNGLSMLRRNIRHPPERVKIENAETSEEIPASIVILTSQ